MISADERIEPPALGSRRPRLDRVLPFEHVAPFVAALLGLNFQDVDGTLLPGLLAVTPEVAPQRRP